jgi:hypothetical protein
MSSVYLLPMSSVHTPHAIVETMMRIDLREPLPSGKSIDFTVDWSYNIVNAKEMWTRGGYETFDDGHEIYTLGQWYPRMAAFDDLNGWQNKQFLGRGEFALEFGDFEVEITVPADHIVASTGTLANAEEVLTATQRESLADAESSKTPVLIVTPDEALANSETAATGTKTWRFEAERVRDFAWASSRRFIWDAMQVDIAGKPVWAMSYYPKEGNPLWERYSTHAIAHTLESYSRHTIPYPYPTALSVNGPVWGMEYPMISFNGPRPEEDGTYSADTKYALISIVIHEVGHNWFPMIINSDERQWTWLDEGLNSFTQFVAEQEWEENYPSRGGHTPGIIEHMTSPDTVPIMTNSESLKQFGANAYAKPSVALNILRETVLGREAFDHAYRQYAERWKFKRPAPADFFRTMEDASGTDLDWFWKGWFYTTGHVDIGIRSVELYELDSRNPEVEQEKLRQRKAEQDAKLISNRANKDIARYTDRFPELNDFYNENDEFTVTPKAQKDYEKLLEDLEPEERELLETDRYFYSVRFVNPGGLAMPIILKMTYEDGSSKVQRIPAEIWRYSLDEVSRLFITQKKITALELDPYLETADADPTNNTWGGEPTRQSFQLFMREESPNLMRLMQKPDSAEDDAETTDPESAPAEDTPQDSATEPDPKAPAGPTSTPPESGKPSDPEQESTNSP